MAARESQRIREWAELFTTLSHTQPTRVSLTLRLGPHANAQSAG